MKTITNVLYNVAIIIWPIVFVFGIGYLELYIRNIVQISFNAKSYIWLYIAYVIAGLVTAFVYRQSKHNLSNKGRMLSYVVSGALVALIAVLYLLQFSIFPFLYLVLSYINLPAFLFMLGFTVYIAVRTILMRAKPATQTVKEIRTRRE